MARSGNSSASLLLYYGELRDTTLTSFVKFIAQGYNAAPVKTEFQAIEIPQSEKCKDFGASMTNMQRVSNAKGRDYMMVYSPSFTSWTPLGSLLCRLA
jgi:hypothetical protein